VKAAKQNTVKKVLLKANPDYKRTELGETQAGAHLPNGATTQTSTIGGAGLSSSAPIKASAQNSGSASSVGTQSGQGQATGFFNSAGSPSSPVGPTLVKTGSPGSNASNPLPITMERNSGGYFHERLPVGQARYYSFEIDPAKQNFAVVMALFADSGLCHMIVSETNVGLDAKYASVLNRYKATNAFGSLYDDGLSPRTLALMSNVGSGEMVRAKSPFGASVYYIMVRNEGDVPGSYNIGVDIH
jgi:hypothetical protein